MIAQTGGSIAMLLNLAGLCHPDRHGSYLRCPPRMIYALDRCVCWPGGDPSQATKYTTQHRYCSVSVRRLHRLSFSEHTAMEAVRRLC